MSRYRPLPRPNYTQVPNVFFDEIMVDLSPSELRVLLYVMRRTFGFQKDADTISLKQMTDGITTRDGRVLDRGAGVSKASATTAVKGLVDKGLVIARRNTSEIYGDEATTYSVRIEAPVFKGLTPLSEDDTEPCPISEQAPPQNLDTQKKALQNKAQKNPERSTIPIKPADFKGLDPARDRNIILRSRIRPVIPGDVGPVRYVAWEDLQAEWDRRNSR